MSIAIDAIFSENRQKDAENSIEILGLIARGCWGGYLGFAEKRTVQF